MICDKCGSENSSDSRFCVFCGNDLSAPKPQRPPMPQPAPEPVPQPAPKPSSPSKPSNQEDIPEEYQPISPWGYLGLSILFSVPLVGFIMLIVFSFKGGNIHRKNYARSYWCALLVGLIVALVVLVIALAILFLTGTALNEALSSGY